MEDITKTVTIDGKEIHFKTGKVAKQAGGSVWVQCGDTVVLVTATAAAEPKPNMNFLPLTVDYQEKMSAAGRIPGGFFKREGRLRADETLTSRIIDRSIRPLFAEGWGCETQIIATVFSADPETPADTLALTGASMALEISSIPFMTPIAGVRIARVDGKFVINPSFEDRDAADLNIFVSASDDAIVMVEGGGHEISEADAIDALLLAHEECKKIIAVGRELRQAVGKEKRVQEPPAEVDAALKEKVSAVATPKLVEALAVREKLARYEALDAAKAGTIDSLLAEDESMAEQIDDIKSVIGSLKSSIVRNKTVKEKIRIDGRGPADIRAIDTEAGLLPRTHGSALFQRGETQALVTTTLGTRVDEQRVDDLQGNRFTKFMLHYNFPPYSVGEARFLRGPGRREIGHGALAHRALEPLVEISEDFPYVIRILSDVTESNGSSSMATVCGGSMSLADAGVPMKGACAGIAMGLIKEGDDMVILSDILGDEDHIGDMDFKVAGTEKGITAIQMDIKIDGVSREVLETALEQARQGRLHILGEMAKTLAAPREEMSTHAPRITTIKIKQDRIRDVIGPGGKVIKDIIARTGCQVDVDDSGIVTVASTDGEGAKMALKMIEDLTRDAEIGKIYLGNVRKITDFGAFVEIFPGTDGLVHISELADKRVNRVEDVLQEGDEVVVKCIGLDKGKIRLSRKEAIADEKAKKEKEAAAAAEA